mmetsp:Transcript_11518/g.17354  ORF Transcript_11518/g.17354 Transcript_11518/m.17354 type:complete len:200 (-) Transcript_11518:629-1228(-)
MQSCRQSTRRRPSQQQQPLKKPRQQQSKPPTSTLTPAVPGRDIRIPTVGVSITTTRRRGCLVGRKRLSSQLLELLLRPRPQRPLARKLWQQPRHRLRLLNLQLPQRDRFSRPVGAPPPPRLGHHQPRFHAQTRAPSLLLKHPRPALHLAAPLPLPPRQHLWLKQHQLRIGSLARIPIRALSFTTTRRRKSRPGRSRWRC